MSEVLGSSLGERPRVGEVDKQMCRDEKVSDCCGLLSSLGVTAEFSEGPGKALI